MMMNDLLADIDNIKSNYHHFIGACSTSEGLYCLTPKSDASAYALCFAIFGYHLLGDKQRIEENSESWDILLRHQLVAKKKQRELLGRLDRDKPYLQLLTFTLSALSILGTLTRDPLADEVLMLIPDNIEHELKQSGVLCGNARTGNHAMFLGVFLLHARDYLGHDTGDALNAWVRLNLQSMNQYGFWGEAETMSHLQFQNGYHQYEIFEYLHVDSVPWNNAADAVASLVDNEGHFAPYPGGGGCYDYDAVFLLTAADSCSINKYSELLMQTSKYILLGQNDDGGFCESHYIRPRSLSNLNRTWNHIWAVQGRARVERFRHGLTLLRPKHNRVHTHWSQYSREWSESDLWDSWFRMLTIARINVALDPEKIKEWGFINYPGIGYHPLLTSS